MSLLERQLAASIDKAREHALAVPRSNVINAAKAWVRAVDPSRRAQLQCAIVLAVQELERMEARYR